MAGYGLSDQEVEEFFFELVEAVERCTDRKRRARLLYVIRLVKADLAKRAITFWQKLE